MTMRWVYGVVLAGSVALVAAAQDVPAPVGPDATAEPAAVSAAEDAAAEPAVPAAAADASPSRRTGVNPLSAAHDAVIAEPAETADNAAETVAGPGPLDPVTGRRGRTDPDSIPSEYELLYGAGLPVPASLRQRIRELDEEATRIAAEIRGAGGDRARGGQKPAGNDAMREQLRRVVHTSFDVRQMLQRVELWALRRRLEAVDRTISVRENSKQEIIERRVSELLNPELRWEASADAESPGSAPEREPIDPAEPGTASHNTPVFKSYQLDQAEADQVAQALAALMPHVVIRDDQRGRGFVHVMATPREHQQVAEWIRMMDGGSGRFQVKLENAPWADVLEFFAKRAGRSLDIAADLPAGTWSYDSGERRLTLAEFFGVLSDALARRGFRLVYIPGKEYVLFIESSAPLTRRSSLGVQPAASVERGGTAAAGAETIFRSPSEFGTGLTEATDRLEHAQRMHKKGFMSEAELERTRRRLQLLQDEYAAQIRLLELELAGAEANLEASQKLLKASTSLYEIGRSTAAEVVRQRQPVEQARSRIERLRTLLDLYRKAGASGGEDPAAGETSPFAQPVTP
jgi:hypothetical protein